MPSPAGYSKENVTLVQALLVVQSQNSLAYSIRGSIFQRQRRRVCCSPRPADPLDRTHAQRAAQVFREIGYEEYGKRAEEFVRKLSRGG